MRGALFFTLLAWLGLGGCAHYELGPGTDLPFSSIRLQPVENRSALPRMNADLSGQLLEELNADPRLKAVASGTADVDLSVQVLRFSRKILARQPDDAALARAYEVRLEALVSLHDRRTGEIYLDALPVAATEEVYFTGSYTENEYQATPVLIRQLAEEITRRVTSVW